MFNQGEKKSTQTHKTNQKKIKPKTNQIMKQSIKTIAVMAIIIVNAGMLFTSCTGSRNLADYRGQAVTPDRCMVIAMEPSSYLRAAATAESENLQFARNAAATLARAEIAASIGIGIDGVFQIYASNGFKLSSTEETEIRAFIAETLRGSRVICSEAFYRVHPNDQHRQIFTASVCVDIDEARMLDRFEALFPNVSTEVNREEFLKRMQEGRNEYRIRRERQIEREGF